MASEEELLHIMCSALGGFGDIIGSITDRESVLDPFDLRFDAHAPRPYQHNFNHTAISFLLVYIWDTVSVQKKC